jgi:hypothetical protein
MHRSLSPIVEHDHLTSSSEATSHEDLPTVTPMLRTFTDTTQRQNAENAKLRKQLLVYQEKEAQLSDRVQELEELTAALVNPTGRNPTDKTANTTTETRHSASAFTPQAAIPSSPLGLTPRVPRPQDVAYQAALNQRQAEPTEAGTNLTNELQTETGVLKLFSKLAQALTENNNADVSSPPHFSGKDDEWETWYSRFRTYLKAKGHLNQLAPTHQASTPTLTQRYTTS